MINRNLSQVFIIQNVREQKTKCSSLSESCHLTRVATWLFFFSTFCQLSKSVIFSHYVQGWDYKFFIVHHQPENAALPTSASSSQVKELIPSIQLMFSPQGFDKHSFISRTNKKKSILQTAHYTENGQITTQFSPILVGNRKVGVKIHTPAVMALLHYVQLALCARLAIASRSSSNHLGLVYQSPRARLPIASHPPPWPRSPWKIKRDKTITSKICSCSN